jgi:hypothetical protein
LIDPVTEPDTSADLDADAHREGLALELVDGVTDIERNVVALPRGDLENVDSRLDEAQPVAWIEKVPIDAVASSDIDAIDDGDEVGVG